MAHPITACDDLLWEKMLHPGAWERRPGAREGTRYSIRKWLSFALYAGTGTARETGFSTIGKLISPEKMPSAIDSHHTGS